MPDILNENYFINREFKNDFFIFLFGKHKDLALSLYNAMNNTSYDDPEEIIFNTIDNFIYIGRHNDVSFLIESTVNVYEHQTTVNANIPLRMFLYISKIYEKYAVENRNILYSEKIIKLPNPNFIVFYYGAEEQPDDRLVHLSDAMDIKGTNLELTARVINANYGHNQYILNKCPALFEYSWFLSEIRVRYNGYVSTGADHKEAMKRAVDEALEIMPEDYIIKNIVIRNKAEVVDMLYSMEDEPRMIRLLFEEKKNEGREEGLREGRTEARAEYFKKTIRLLMKTGISEEEATKMTEEEYYKSAEQ